MKSLEVDLARAMVATTSVPASAVVAAMHANENLLMELGNSLGDQAAKRAQDAATSAVEIGRLRAALADAGIPAPATQPRARRQTVFDAVARPRLEDVRRERERSDLLSVQEYICPKPTWGQTAEGWPQAPQAQHAQLGGSIQTSVTTTTSSATTTTTHVTHQVNNASFVGLELGF